MSSNGDVPPSGLLPERRRPPESTAPRRQTLHGSGRERAAAPRHATMRAWRDLELIDCGDGRRLERFGDVLVDRPAPERGDATAARRPPSGSERALRWTVGAWARDGDRPGWTVRRRPASCWSAGRRPAVRSGCSRSTPRRGTGSTARSRAAGVALEPAAGDPVAVRVHRRRDARLRPGRRARHARGRIEAGGRLGAPERGAVGPRRPARSAGSSTTCARSCAASGGAAGTTTASSSTRRPTGTVPAPWKIETDLAPLLDDLAALARAAPGARPAERPHARASTASAWPPCAASTSASRQSPGETCASSHAAATSCGSAILGADARA